MRAQIKRLIRQVVSLCTRLRGLRVSSFLFVYVSVFVLPSVDLTGWKRGLVSFFSVLRQWKVVRRNPDTA